MPKVLIADDVSPECPRILRNAGLEVDARGKMKPDEVKAVIGGYEGLVVRSALKVTREIIEAGSRLRIIGRAGVGVDNIDVEAASRRGVIVMNAPLGNINSAAEHTWALLMANARHVVPAESSLRAGKWERGPYVGVELEGKTIGIVGLGKVGAQVSRFAKGFSMRVIAYDPLLVRERAEVLGVELVELDRLLAESDFVTLHLPLTEKTRGLIGPAQLARMKSSARIVNCSRGGIVDEAALAAALGSGKLAGAALDVFESEPPPKDHPLFKLPNVTLTPHLGASTEEAQLRVSVDVAEQFVDYFARGVVRNAVNLAGASDPAIIPFLKLSAQLGAVAGQLAGDKPRQVEVTFLGAVGAFETSAMTQEAVAGVLRLQAGSEVNPVNARATARERGIQIVEERRKDARNYKSLVQVRVEAEDGTVRTVQGTVFEGGAPRIVQVDAFDIDLRPSKHMLVMVYPDVPGKVGAIGSVLGGAGINISRMEVGRDGRGGQAMLMLAVDDPVPASVAAELRAKASVVDLVSIEMPE